MEATSSPARYLTLRDYLRVLRRYRIAIVLIAAIGAAAGYIAAKRQTPVFDATASVSFQDPAQDLTLVGLGGGLVQNPSALAAASAETLNRPQVMTAVRHRLKHAAGNATSDSVSGQVSQAGLLQISARSTSPRSAARLANAVADVVVSQGNSTTRSGFASAADDVNRQIATTRTSSRTPATNTRLQVYEDELARLKTLSRFATSAQVAQRASVPTSPASPNTLRSTVIGLALGLALAIAVAFFRDSMDPRLRTSRDIESGYGLPVLGHLRNRGLGRVAREGVGEQAGDSADVETFRIVRRNLQFLNLDSPPRSVIVTSAGPEEGKTTVAGSLAFAMASSGKRTMLVDCDLRRPTLATRLGLREEPGLCEFLSGEATPNDVLRPINLPDPPSSNGASADVSGTTSSLANLLVVIPAGAPSSHATELLGSKRFHNFVEEVVEAYDVVIFDSSPLLPVADTLEMLPQVEGVVICARESKITRGGANGVNAILARFPDLPRGLVITGIKPGGSDDPDYAYSYS